jgi:hypothetical protein
LAGWVGLRCGLSFDFGWLLGGRVGSVLVAVGGRSLGQVTEGGLAGARLGVWPWSATSMPVLGGACWSGAVPGVGLVGNRLAGGLGGA